MAKKNEKNALGKLTDAFNNQPRWVKGTVIGVGAGGAFAVATPFTPLLLTAGAGGAVGAWISKKFK